MSEDLKVKTKRRVVGDPDGAIILIVALWVVGSIATFMLTVFPWVIGIAWMAHHWLGVG